MKTSKMPKSRNVTVAPKSKPQVVNRKGKGHKDDNPRNFKHSSPEYKMKMSKTMKSGMKEVSDLYQSRLKGTRPEPKPFKRRAR